MKKTKTCLTICLVLLLFLLTACGGETSNVRTVEYQNKTYTIEQNPNSMSGIITVENMACEFGVSGGGSHTQFKVTYPDGSSYSMTFTQGETVSTYGAGWSDDYDPPYYAKGDVLWDVLEKSGSAGKENRSGPIFLGMLVAGLGVLNVMKPKAAWYVNHGWRYKNAEPSEAALMFSGLGGVVAIIVGLGMMFFG